MYIYILQTYSNYISNLLNGGHECSQFLGQRSGSGNRQDIFDGFHGSLENISDGIQSTGPEERCNNLKIGKKGKSTICLWLQET